MSEAKFTKGDWIAFKDGKWSDCGSWSADNDEVSSYSNVAVNVGNVTICLVVSESWDDSEMEANAHLIAAAPKMYEMLEQLSNSIPTVCENHEQFCLRIEINDLLAEVRGEKNGK